MPRCCGAFVLFTGRGLFTQKKLHLFTISPLPVMRRFCIIILLLTYCSVSFGQKEWSNWYSNGRELLTFKNGYAERVTNFITNIPPVPPFENYYHYYHSGYGGISYSDPVTGDMRFIVSNRIGYSSDFFDFPNDTFLRSCPDQKSYHIIPFHNDPDKFYVLQFQSAGADLIAQESGLQVRCPNAIGLGYSIADLSLNGGLGDFSSVNNVITTGLTEQITTVRHANGRDVWVIIHPYGGAEYHAILISDAGIQPAVRSNIGPVINGGYISIGGTLAASHDGKVLASYWGGPNNSVGIVDFDNSTGLLNNYRVLPYNGPSIKLQFSPDNSKLYSLGYDVAYTSPQIFQWDLNQPDIGASGINIGVGIQTGANIFDMQLAPDGKIYITSFQEYVNNQFHSYLMAIECPNLPKYACNLNKRAIEIDAPAFPPLINDFINQQRVIPPPQFSLGNDTAICFGSLTITAPAGWQSYRWNTGDSSQSITVTKAGTYFVLTGSLGFSCPAGYGYINVADKAIKLNLGKDSALCKGDTYLLQVPADYTNIVWSNGSTVRDSLIKGRGYCIINATDVNGCYTGDTISVYEKYYPDASFGTDTTLCNNEVVLLRLTPPKTPFTEAEYLWHNGSTEDTFTVRQPGTFWGTVTYDGCTVSDTLTVSYVSGDQVTLGNDTVLCEGDSLQLSASVMMARYLWNTGDTTRSIFVKYSGNYWIQVTNGNCTVRDTIGVTFAPKPVLFLGNDTALCEKDSLVLTANTGTGNYSWQDGSSQHTFIVKTSGIYRLAFSQNGCTVSDSIDVLFKPLPPVALGNDTGFCTASSFFINAFSPVIQSYTWQDQSSGPGFTATAAGSYSVQVTGVNGCINRDTILLVTVPLPAFDLGADTVLCEGGIINYDFSMPGAMYSWNNGSTNNQHQITSAGVHWLMVTHQGCSKTDSVLVTYKPYPVVNFGNDTTLCMGVSKLLSAVNSNALYRWQDGSSNNTFTVTSEGLYFVRADLDGCVSSDTINIDYTSPPVFTLGNDTFICKGDNILLQPEGIIEGAYYWQDGSNVPLYNVKDTGIYRLTVSNECGTHSSSIKISQGVCQLYLPTAFTPDQNGLNDVFKIKYPFAVKQFHFTVYNRYGQTIFETNDMSKGWNGDFKGKAQPAGTYVWQISFSGIDGRSKILAGHVVLIR